MYKKVSELDSCPYCGGEEFYVRERYKGTCVRYIRFDGDEATNAEMYMDANHKVTSKFAYCMRCDKRIAELDDGWL